MMVYEDKENVKVFVINFDDIIITGNNIVLIKDAIHKLNLTFVLKHLGYLNYFLGIKMIRTKDSFHLSQQKYIQ